MAFRATLERTTADFHDYRQMHRKLHFRVGRILCNVIWVIGVLALVLVVVAATAFRFWDLPMVLSVIVYALLLVFYLTMDWVLGYVSVKLQLKGPLELNFAEEELQVTSPKLREQYPYGSITEITHYKRCYYLYLDKNHAIMLPERCFTEGDPKAFGAFIAEKSGVPVQEMN